MRASDSSKARAGDPATETPIRKVIRLAMEGKYGKAIALAKSLHAKHPANPQVAAWLGYCLVETGRKKRGHELLESSVYEHIRSVKPRIGYLRSLISDRSEDARRVHAELTGKVEVIARNYLSVDGGDTLSKAYAAEYNAARATAVTPPQLLVFNHLPFTGGTSVQAALGLAFQKSGFYNIKRRSGLICIHKFNSLPPQKLDTIRYIHLHHPYPLDTRGIPAARLTILRDPVSYFLSGYFKRRNLGKKIIASRDMLIKDGGLPEAVDLATQYGMHNGLARQLAVLHPDFAASYAKHYRSRKTLADILRGRLPKNPHLDYLQYEEDLFYPKATADLSETSLFDLATDVLENGFCQPGVIKHLEAGFLAAMAKLGYSVTPRMPHRGASKRPPRESIAQDVKDRIAELNPVDQKLYDRALAAFERDHAGLITAIGQA